jgi:hypothetical protein
LQSDSNASDGPDRLMVGASLRPGGFHVDEDAGSALLTQPRRSIRPAENISLILVQFKKYRK